MKTRIKLIALSLVIVVATSSCGANNKMGCPGAFGKAYKAQKGKTV